MAIEKFEVGPIKHFILLGLPDIADDIENYCNQAGVKFYLLTSSDQMSKGFYKGERALVVDTLQEKRVLQFLDFDRSCPEEVLAISVGARWIVKEEMRNRLFCGNMLNAHGARLPIDRGPGGFSWRIMRGDRIGNLLMHIVDDGIDTGPLIMTEEYIVPRHVRTPQEFMDDYRHRLKSYIIKIIGQTSHNKLSINPNTQQSYLSVAFQRLYTPQHSFIDWNMNPVELEKFILAFEAPYLGAQSYWKEKLIHIREAQLHIGEVGFHPFQAGMVVRNNGSWLVVALEGKYSLLIESVQDSEGIDLLPDICEGDRLHTPISALDEARSTRVVIGPKGAM